MTEEDINLGRFFELATNSKIHVNRLNLHETLNEFFLEYTGDFEMIRSMLIGEGQQKTNIRFENVEDIQSYTKTVDVDYDSENVICEVRLYRWNTLQFKVVNRSQYGRCTSFKQDFVEYIGNNCFLPKSGNCFIKCNNRLTDNDYTEEFVASIRTEQRRSKVMTSARIEPFCKKHNINIGCYDVFRVCLRNITERNIAL